MKMMTMMLSNYSDDMVVMLTIKMMIDNGDGDDDADER